MTEIQNNRIYPQNLAEVKYTVYTYGAAVPAAPPLIIRDEFVKQHKKNGLFEKLYNKIKNLTGLGTGSKKVKTAINKAESGEISEDYARGTIDKYRKSQANSEQAFGDLVSIGASGMSFYWLRKILKMKNAEMTINKDYYDKIAKSLKKAGEGTGHGFWGKVAEDVVNSGKSNKKMMAVTAVAAGLVGGWAKLTALNLNGIGSDEFKYRKKDFNGSKTPYDKAAYKLEKKTKQTEKMKAGFRNFVSGAINGIMMPVTLFGGAIAGIPLYLAGNSLNRYFIGNHEEKGKSFNKYVDNLKNDSITHAALAAAAVVPMIKEGRFTKVFDANLKKTVEKLSGAVLKESELKGKTAYAELEDILLKQQGIKDIINSRGDVGTIINKLTEENIFAVKFKQIQEGADALTLALKEECPSTRTIREAQQYINEMLGEGYKVSKNLGTGTIAETYLATAPDGKEVCLKILKKGISKEKISNDMQKFIEIIKKLDKSQEEKDYLIKNIENIAGTIIKEVDFQNEADAAKKLAQNIKTANVVKPIEVKNGVYIMEKAEGISLDSFAKLARLLQEQSYYEKVVENVQSGKIDEGTQYIIDKWFNGSSEKYLETQNRQLTWIKNKIQQLKDKTPEFKDITLNNKDVKYMFEELVKVFTEIFYKVDKNGKVIHGDPHLGNIIINYEAVKSGKGKVFTMIDAGNIIEMSKEQAMRSVNLSQYIERGDAADIAKYMLAGANLSSSSLNKERAQEIITQELKDCFFDNKTKLGIMTNDTMYNLVSNIMRKHKIIPAPDNASLEKAKRSAASSYDELQKILYGEIFKKMSQEGSKMNQAANAVGGIKDMFYIEQLYKKSQKKQQKLNLLLMSPAERIKYLRNPNLPALNSEEYLTYKLKQQMK